MDELPHHPEPDPNRSSRVYFFILVGLIAAALAAFLIVRPRPS